ncbi:MAG: transcriptional activator NhaR [Desulfobulbaceae bacterium]
MEWLNYHHMYYFWTVMKEGSITAASAKLRLAQSTVSTQISRFEESLGSKLFRRVGRTLEPTDIGHLVFRYADEIFSLGYELLDTLAGKAVSGPLTLKAGIVDVVPKLVAKKLLEPVSGLPEQVRLVCREGKVMDLLGELALHNLDIVLTDSPLPPGISIKAYNHILGECGVSFFGTREIAGNLGERFPDSLDGAPMLLPMPMSSLRGSLDQWFEKKGIKPLVVGEFDDSALMKVFGQAGEGVFPAPTVIEKEVEQHYSVKVLGRTLQVKEKFYAISAERIIKHPAVAAISEAASRKLFF